MSSSVKAQTFYYVTCNVGMVPKLTMTVTGTETEKSVKLKKNGKFEI